MMNYRKTEDEPAYMAAITEAQNQILALQMDVVTANELIAAYERKIVSVVAERDRLTAENAALVAQLQERYELQMQSEEAARAEMLALIEERNAIEVQLRDVTEKASTAKHAQVLTLTEERDTLTAERNRLRDALHMCDVVMDTAAMHGLPQHLPPAYKESWAAVHTNAREVLKEIE